MRLLAFNGIQERNMGRPGERRGGGAPRLSGFVLLPLLVPFLLIGIFYSSVHMVEQGCQLLPHSHVFLLRHPGTG